MASRKGNTLMEIIIVVIITINVTIIITIITTVSITIIISLIITINNTIPIMIRWILNLRLAIPLDLSRRYPLTYYKIMSSLYDHMITYDYMIM